MDILPDRPSSSFWLIWTSLNFRIFFEIIASTRIGWLIDRSSFLGLIFTPSIEFLFSFNLCSDSLKLWDFRDFSLNPFRVFFIEIFLSVMFCVGLNRLAHETCPWCEFIEVSMIFEDSSRVFQNLRFLRFLLRRFFVLLFGRKVLILLFLSSCDFTLMTSRWIFPKIFIFHEQLFLSKNFPSTTLFHDHSYATRIQLFWARNNWRLLNWIT